MVTLHCINDTAPCHQWHGYKPHNVRASHTYQVGLSERFKGKETRDKGRSRIKKLSMGAFSIRRFDECLDWDLAYLISELLALQPKLMWGTKPTTESQSSTKNFHKKNLPRRTRKKQEKEMRLSIPEVQINSWYFRITDLLLLSSFPLRGIQKCPPCFCYHEVLDFRLNIFLIHLSWESLCFSQTSYKP